MDITNGVDTTLAIKEHILFGAFDSREYGLRLLERSAPVPSEKGKKDGTPFSHGLYDFGDILGERIYNERTVTYRFQVTEHDYARRKNIQTVIENALIKEGVARLEDTFSPYYSFKGKALSVSTEDDHAYNRLILNVDFECYPFKQHELKEGNDIWDSFNFELDVSQETSFVVDGSKTVTLINPGTPSVAPKITTDSDITIQIGARIFPFAAGTSQNNGLRLFSGENTLILEGNATVSFDFHKELV